MTWCPLPLPIFSGQEILAQRRAVDSNQHQVALPESELGAVWHSDAQRGFSRTWPRHTTLCHAILAWGEAGPIGSRYPWSTGGLPQMPQRLVALLPSTLSIGRSCNTCNTWVEVGRSRWFSNVHRIGWWENLQENPIFDGKNPWVSGSNFPLNQSSEMFWVFGCVRFGADPLRRDSGWSPPRRKGGEDPFPGAGGSQLVPHCTQWFCWSLSLLNGYNWGYAPFSDIPKSKAFLYETKLVRTLLQSLSWGLLRNSVCCAVFRTSRQMELWHWRAGSLTTTQCYTQNISQQLMVNSTYRSK